jgi:hypothetical protein
MIKRLLLNKKGTAEVIGSVMFIVILLFFFTNVYLWHDAAVKEMNELQVQKINSPIIVDPDPDNSHNLIITNKGGIDATLSVLWINVEASSSPDRLHKIFDLTDDLPAIGAVKIVKAGSTYTINLEDLSGYVITSEITKFTVITTSGNLASRTLTITNP